VSGRLRSFLDIALRRHPAYHQRHRSAPTHWTIGHTTENVTVEISGDHGGQHITPDDLTDLGVVPVEDGTVFVFRPGPPDGDAIDESETP
jgi:hypothetical protein